MTITPPVFISADESVPQKIGEHKPDRSGTGASFQILQRGLRLVVAAAAVGERGEGE